MNLPRVFFLCLIVVPRSTYGFTLGSLLNPHHPSPRAPLGIRDRKDLKGQKASSFTERYDAFALQRAATLRGGALLDAKATTAGAKATKTQGRALAGKLMPFLSKFAITPKNAGEIYHALVQAVDTSEFAVLAVFSWVLKPLVKFLYNQSQEMKDPSEKRVPFKNTPLYSSVRTVTQAARIGVFIYAVDCLAIILNGMGFKYLQQTGFSQKAANISFIAWLALRIRNFKRYLINKAFQVKKKPQQAPRAKVYDSISTIFLYLLAAFVIVDRLDLDFGVALSSFFAFGGVGTLVISLASKDLASQLVSGLALSTSDRFQKGDEVVLGDGTSGKINKVGVLYTEVRGSNEVIVKIPNSQIANQRSSNISRGKVCQVKQTLRFGYEDLPRLPSILRAIKEEIKDSCPELITDGSRPFRVVFKDYQPDHLEVLVDCRFNLPPSGDLFWNNRQAVLLAIARATRDTKVEFAIPNILNKNVDLKSASRASSS